MVAVHAAVAQDARQPAAVQTVPQLATLTNSSSDLVSVVVRFAADRASLTRRYDAPDSPTARRRFRQFYNEWRERLRESDFDKLHHEGRADYALLDNLLQHELALLDRDDRQRVETAPLLPFADRLLGLHDARRGNERVDHPKAARIVADAARQIDSLRALFEPPAARGGVAVDPLTRPQAPRVSGTVANRAAQKVDTLRRTLTAWQRHYDGYDPLFSWWLREPYRMLDSALVRYARTLRQQVVGIRPEATALNRGPVIGDPVGAEGLREDLRYEMIPYNAEELIAIAEREYAFSLAEMKKAAREMGFGDDWKAAMEKVKNTYVEPGKQPELVVRLAREAEALFDRNDWVTIPPLAREDWVLEMLSVERQRVAPFLLGGNTVQVAYPTSDMADDEKQMSLRGNNPHFSHAVVFHELNPGHHLQNFMLERYNPHRSIFRTPFWNEGNALYWEMFLWDSGKFHVTPEDRVGALFWRMHRSARIIFSLNFHLGKMTADHAVQFLVDTVNFERANAEGEVRRSFTGQFSPLYQAAYMLGGLQLRALHRELVTSGKLTNRQFHDAFLQGGAMPISMVRARLANIPLSRSGPPPWRFAEQLPPPVAAPAP